MGLDNMPNVYPCKSGGTAVMEPVRDKDGNPILKEDGETMMRVNCFLTQAASGCPYKNAREKTDLGGGEVYGMFGTDCWYRGKYGNWLIERLGLNDDEFNFYGENSDGTLKSPTECEELADIMEDAFYEMGGRVLDETGDSLDDEVRHAIWYLRWSAEYCGGLQAWY